MEKLILMVGLPGSGKSSYAKIIAKKEKAVIVSTDDIRYELFGDERQQKNSSKVFYEVYSRIEEHLSNQRNVVFDATNLDRKRRIHVISKFEEKFQHLQIMACYMDTPFEICVKRNASRKKQVENWVLEKLRKSMTIPFYSEGFDEIITVHESVNLGISNDEFVSLLKEEKSYQELFERLVHIPMFHKMKDFNQENPHHSLTLCKHTYSVLEYINAFYEGEDQLLMQVAALFHDIGKLFCKKFKPLKGYYSYYAHELVSSQIAFHFLYELGFEEEFIFQVIGIIEMHMKIAYGGESGASEIYHLLGGDLLTKLYIFNEADRFAK